MKIKIIYLFLLFFLLVATSLVIGYIISFYNGPYYLIVSSLLGFFAGYAILQPILSPLFKYIIHRRGQ